MTELEAKELIERMLYITTFSAKKEKILLSIYDQALKSDDPENYIKIIKTCHQREKEAAKKGISLSKAERNYENEAKARLHTIFVESLGIDESKIEDYIIECIKKI